MKLAEALLLRGDLQRKLASLRERIEKNTLVQEDERPSEDPNTLLAQAEAVVGQLEKLVYAINEADLAAAVERMSSLAGSPNREAVPEFGHNLGTIRTVA